MCLLFLSLLRFFSSCYITSFLSLSLLFLPFFFFFQPSICLPPPFLSLHLLSSYSSWRTHTMKSVNFLPLYSDTRTSAACHAASSAVLPCTHHQRQDWTKDAKHHLHLHLHIKHHHSTTQHLRGSGSSCVWQYLFFNLKCFPQTSHLSSLRPECLKTCWLKSDWVLNLLPHSRHWWDLSLLGSFSFLLWYQARGWGIITICQTSTCFLLTPTKSSLKDSGRSL